MHRALILSAVLAACGGASTSIGDGDADRDGDEESCTPESCDDSDPCSIDECVDGACVHTDDSDRDHDGHSRPECGGDDCDDDDPLRWDCPGCEAPVGLNRLASIDTPATGLFVIGSVPGAPADHEVFVGTPEAIEVYGVGDAGDVSLLGSTPYPGVEPLSPQVLGPYTLVGDFGAGGIWLYETADLRAGGAVALAHVGDGLGTVAAMVADGRRAYVVDGDGVLSSTATTALPSLPEPAAEAGAGGWQTSTALALERGSDGGWLFGVLGQYFSFAELDGYGAVTRSGRATVTEGFAWDVATLPDWLAIAQGDRGLMLVDRGRVVDDDRCCSEADFHFLSLPRGCSSATCENAVAVAAARPSRAVVGTYVASGSQRSSLHLVDISSPSAMVVLGHVVLSHSSATVREVVVSGDRVYVAAKVEAESSGVVDVFDLMCE